MVILHAGGMQDSTQPMLEFFPENKHGWIGGIKAERASKI